MPAADRPNLVVIGGGAMAGAILRGAIGARRDPGAAPLAISAVVVEPDATRRDALRSLPGVTVAETIAQVAAPLQAGVNALLAVKPQSLADVGAQAAAGRATPTGLVVSILAGAPSDSVRAALGGACRVVRVMPNLPAQIGMGMSAIARGAGATPEDLDFARRLFSCVGDVVEINESLMDAFTAVAGSGPAYLFYLAEGMRNGAVAAGFDEPTADRVTRAVLAGAAALLAGAPDRSPESWRAAVTSKGGTTEAAIRALDAAAAMDAVTRAVLAARDRAAELGR